MSDPIKRPLLRAPGQSLDEEFQKILDESFHPWFVIVVSLVFIASYSWLIHLTDFKNNPYLVTVVAMTGVVVFAIYVLKTRKVMRRLSLGRKGERSVAQYLVSNLTNETCRVYNDVIFEESFNIDHIIVSTNGVWVIETKTLSKPDGLDAKIYARDDGIHGPNWVNHDYIGQVNRNVTYLEKWLKTNFDIEVKCRGVLLFPGWYVRDERSKKDHWVLAPKAFLDWFRKEGESLSIDTYNRIKKLLYDHIVLREGAIEAD